MTANEFRKLALSLPETVEQSHMNHPDFRVGGKIFATLCPDDSWGMARLRPDQQAPLVEDQPDVFQPASGAWGRAGATIIQLKPAKKATVRAALMLAWRNRAPKKLLDELDAK